MDINSRQDRERMEKLMNGFFDDPAFDVNGLSDEDFKLLLSVLTRVFFCRVWNCVDASGKNDREWSRTSDVMDRAFRMLGGKVEEQA